MRDYTRIDIANIKKNVLLCLGNVCFWKCKTLAIFRQLPEEVNQSMGRLIIYPSSTERSNPVNLQYGRFLNLREDFMCSFHVHVTVTL